MSCLLSEQLWHQRVSGVSLLTAVSPDVLQQEQLLELGNKQQLEGGRARALEKQAAQLQQLSYF